MSLRRNIVANYASQIYVAIVGIAMLPLYVRYLGVEAYGLIGFYTMMQSWFSMLDLGLSPTISRETAKYFGGGLSGREFRQLFRSLSVIFVLVAIVGGGGIALFSADIATRWLKFKLLPLREVVIAIQVMGVTAALRWLGGLYRGVVSGAERQVSLAAITALIATLRFFAVFASMWFFGYTPRVFFLHQLAVAAVEIALLAVSSYRLLPRHDEIVGVTRWSLDSVKPLLKFSLTIAFTSAVWIAVTQSDKLILSGLLDLADYGYFSLAVTVAGGITMVIAPISAAVTPRLARLHVEGRHDELLVMYRKATRLTTAVAGTITVALVICAEEALYAWTGNRALANKAARILQLYAVGNGLLAVGAFPFYLQYARGNLSYHLIGNLLIAIFLFPALVIAARQFGAVGAGYVWVAMNVLYLFLWVAYVHHKLTPGLHVHWMWSDIGRTLAPILALGATIFAAKPLIETRVEGLIFSLISGLILATPSLFQFRRERRDLVPVRA